MTTNMGKTSFNFTFFFCFFFLFFPSGKNEKEKESIKEEWMLGYVHTVWRVELLSSETDKPR